MFKIVILGTLAALAAGCAVDAGDPSDPSEDVDDLEAENICLKRHDRIGANPAHTASKIAARYPIVLVHGFNGSATNGWSFFQVVEALESDHHVVEKVELPPFNSVEKRAAHLKVVVEDIRTRHKADKVNIIAHSMGGVDARYLVSTQGLDYPHVASITMISSPHRGTAVADLALRVLKGKGVVVAANMITKWWATTFTSQWRQTDLVGAFGALAEKNAGAINEVNLPDRAGVFYQSWAGVSAPLLPPGVVDKDKVEACKGAMTVTKEGDQLKEHPAPFNILGGEKIEDLAAAKLQGGFWVVGHVLSDLPSGLAKLNPSKWKWDANDGLVTVKSARWGTFRGCIPADHLDEVGQPKHKDPLCRTGFDHKWFYRNVAFELAHNGF